MSRVLPTGRRLIAIDVALLIWIGGWIWGGVAVGNRVQGLENITTTVVKTGQAVTSVADILVDFTSLPLVGGKVDQAAQQVREAGQSAVASGRQSRGSIEDLSTLLALAVAIIPSAPLLGIYLPVRLSRWRERLALRRALAAPGTPNQAILRLLAERALTNVPYPVLRSVARDPWSELAAGRYEALAAAELDRLGLSLPRRATPPSPS